MKFAPQIRDNVNGLAASAMIVYALTERNSPMIYR
jgi:hypothetical protein